MATDERYAAGTINLPEDLDATRPRGTPRLDFVCNAGNHRVVVDTDSSGNVRYRVWNKPQSVTDKPDVEIMPGSNVLEGRGPCAYPIWTFEKGDTRFNVEGRGCSPDSSPPRRARGASSGSQSPANRNSRGGSIDAEFRRTATPESPDPCPRESRRHPR